MVKSLEVLVLALINAAEAQYYYDYNYGTTGQMV